MHLVCRACEDQQRRRAASTRYNIRSIPTLILFKGGAELARLSGAVPAAQLTSWIRQHVPQGAV